MSEMFPVPERATSTRLRGLQILSPRETLVVRIRERLLRPIAGARRSLAARISIAAISVSLLLVLLAVTIGAAMVQLTGRTEQGRILREASLASSELTGAIADTRYHVARFAAKGERQEMDEAHATLARAKNRLGDARDHSAGVDAKARESMEWLQYQVEGFEKELTALQNNVTAWGPSSSGTALAEAIDISGGQLAGQARGVEGDLAKASAGSDEELVSLTRRLAAIVVGLLLVCIVITLAGARFVARTTAGSIREITGAMTGLAQGDRSVGIPETARQDEIGEMARSLAVFRDSADALANLQIQVARDELARQEAEHARQAELMREVALRFERTVGEVAGSVASASEQLQLTATEMAAAARQSADLTDTVSRSVKDTTSGMTAAASASDQFALSIGEISRQASSSAGVAQDARRAAHGADETIAGLAEAAKEIEQIVAMIGGIAQQTNLLALNASIEAARSGEAGRGFAVVAGEVKNLAGQTGAATDTVADRIKAIQAATRNSVEALRRIGLQVREMEGGAVAIAQSVDEQTLASQDLARNIAIAAGGASEIGQSIGQVSEMAQATGTAASQVLGSASELHRQAAVLREQVGEFLGYVRQG